MRIFGGGTLRRAWFAVAAIPVGFVIAMLIGEGLLAWVGEPAEGESVGLGTALVVGVPALAVFLIAPLAAFGWGRQARAEGDPRGRLPATLGLFLGVGFVVLNLAAFLVGR